MKFFVGIFIPGVFAIQVKKEGSASSALDAGDVLVTSPHDDHDGNITFSKTPPFGPWECYAELDFPTTWYEYCDAPSPKSFSMTDKCAHASWSSGLGSGATMAALSDCTHKTGLFGDKCYTYDNNGKNCHQRYCIPSDVNFFLSGQTIAPSAQRTRHGFSLKSVLHMVGQMKAMLLNINRG
mmetsp:Transcript_77709/g.157832  ORF Transcript_77709/g.157832 Transcript_77709/m.157832 type:complete len:181 (+) Transcript_77709:147-689(+)